jgi:hypothetical protein
VAQLDGPMEADDDAWAQRLQRQAQLVEDACARMAEAEDEASLHPSAPPQDSFVGNHGDPTTADQSRSYGERELPCNDGSSTFASAFSREPATSSSVTSAHAPGFAFSPASAGRYDQVRATVGALKQRVVELEGEVEVHRSGHAATDGRAGDAEQEAAHYKAQVAELEQRAEARERDAAGEQARAADTAKASAGELERESCRRVALQHRLADVHAELEALKARTASTIERGVQDATEPVQRELELARRDLEAARGQTDQLRRSAVEERERGIRAATEPVQRELDVALRELAAAREEVEQVRRSAVEEAEQGFRSALSGAEEEVRQAGGRVAAAAQEEAIAKEVKSVLERRNEDTLQRLADCERRLQAATEAQGRAEVETARREDTSVRLADCERRLQALAADSERRLQDVRAEAERQSRASLEAQGRAEVDVAKMQAEHKQALEARDAMRVDLTRAQSEGAEAESEQRRLLASLVEIKATLADTADQSRRYEAELAAEHVRAAAEAQAETRGAAALAEARGKADRLRSELSQVSQRAAAELGQSRGRVTELEGDVRELRLRVGAVSTDAAARDGELTRKCAGLQRRADEMTHQCEEARRRAVALEEAARGSEQRAVDLEASNVAAEGALERAQARHEEERQRAAADGERRGRTEAQAEAQALEARHAANAESARREGESRLAGEKLKDKALVANLRSELEESRRLQRAAEQAAENAGVVLEQAQHAALSTSESTSATIEGLRGELGAAEAASKVWREKAAEAEDAVRQAGLDRKAAVETGQAAAVAAARSARGEAGRLKQRVAAAEGEAEGAQAEAARVRGEHAALAEVERTIRGQLRAADARCEAAERRVAAAEAGAAEEEVQAREAAKSTLRDAAGAAAVRQRRAEDVWRSQVAALEERLASMDVGMEAAVAGRRMATERAEALVVQVCYFKYFRLYIQSIFSVKVSLN